MEAISSSKKNAKIEAKSVAVDVAKRLAPKRGATLSIDKKG